MHDLLGAVLHHARLRPTPTNLVKQDLPAPDQRIPKHAVLIVHLHTCTREAPQTIPAGPVPVCNSVSVPDPEVHRGPVAM